MSTPEEERAAGPAAAEPAVEINNKKLNQDFRRCATEAQKAEISAMIGNQAKAAYRLAWHKERLQNVKGQQTLKETETKTDYSDGWYMNELQLVQDLGGLIDMERARAKAKLIMKKRLERGWPMVTWDSDLEEMCYYNARKGHRTSSSTETTRELSGEFEITEEAVAEAERKGLGKLPAGVVELALRDMTAQHEAQQHTGLQTPPLEHAARQAPPPEHAALPQQQAPPPEPDHPADESAGLGCNDGMPSEACMSFLLVGKWPPGKHKRAHNG